MRRAAASPLVSDELGLEASDEIGQLALAPPDFFQLRDERRALPVGFVEKPAEDQSETARTVTIRQALGEVRDFRQPFFCRDASRRKALNQIGNLGIGTPVAKVCRLWAIPISRGCKAGY